MDRNYLKRAAISLLVFVFIAAFVLYVGYQVRHFFSKEVETVPARVVEKTYTARCDGYVFRREAVISASAAGTLSPLVADGTHVHVGESVAGIYTVDDPQARENLRVLREQLSLLRDYAASSKGAKDAASVDQRIYSLMTQIKTLAAKNDLAGVIETRSKLLVELAERDVITGASASDFSELIADVEGQIAAETAKLGAQKSVVTADSSGWYYSATDGYEGIFDAEQIDAITVPEFERLVDEIPRETGGGGGKLVLDNEWYLAILTSKDEASALDVSDRIPVTFAYNGQAELSMTVRRVVLDPDSDRALVVFSSTELRPGFSFLRRQTVEMNLGSVSGFSVPVSAVRLVDGELGVYVFNGVYANFRRIIVLKEFDDQYIVQTDKDYFAESMREEQRQKNAESRAESESKAESRAQAESAAALRGETLAPETEDPADYIVTTAEPKTDPPETEETEEGTTQTETQTPFVAADAPLLTLNDLIVVEGKDMYEGKLIS